MEDRPALPAGYRLASFETLDSTNAEARRGLAEGAGAGTVIWARSQAAGRGRQERVWQSPPGNLYTSLIVRPPEGHKLAELAFVSGVAAAEAVAKLLPDAAAESLALKWPNDLLLARRKAGGILIETADTGGRGLHAIIGIGVNVARAPALSDRETACLADHAGAPVSVPALLAALVGTFDGWYRRWCERGLAPVRANWLARAAGLGEEIEAHTPLGLVRGAFIGLDSGGELLVREPGGKRHRIDVADVMLRGN